MILTLAETMTESKVYSAKAPFDILESILKRLDPLHCLYGSFLYRLIDPKQALETIPRQLNVQMSRLKLDKFIQLLDDTGFLRLSMTRSTILIGESYNQAQLELEINGSPFSLEILALQGGSSGNLKPWTDFTCNNLAFFAKNTGTAISLRVSDPQGKLSDEQFMGQCFRDIYAHKLVPMCPDAHLRLTDKSHPHIRRQYVKMVRHAMHHMAQGWTLEPSLTGKKLDFTRYMPRDSPDVCVICQEKMADLAVTLVCGHSFHIDCLYRQMMESGPTSYKCSLCNKHILFSGKSDKVEKHERPSHPLVRSVAPSVPSAPSAPASELTHDPGLTSGAAPDSIASTNPTVPAAADSSTPAVAAVAASSASSASALCRVTRESSNEDGDWIELTGDEIRVRGQHVIPKRRHPLVREIREGVREVRDAREMDDDEEIDAILSSAYRNNDQSPRRCPHSHACDSSSSSDCCSDSDESDC
jgi:hypothetical protein